MWSFIHHGVRCSLRHRRRIEKRNVTPTTCPQKARPFYNVQFFLFFFVLV
jgi:hypothetical protein